MGKHNEKVTHLCLLKNGTTLFSSSEDKTIKIWELKEYTEIMQLDISDGYIEKMILSKNGDFLFTGSSSNFIKKWDITSNREIITLGKHKNSITSMVLSKKENFLFTGGKDNKIKIFDLENNKEICILGSHDTPLTCLCLSQNEEFLYSGSEDNKIKIWDLKKILMFDKLFLEYTILNKNFSQDLFIEKIEIFKFYFKYMIFTRYYYNPIMICIIFQFSKALEKILKEKTVLYYESNKFQISPLILAFKIKNVDIIKILLKYLKRPENISFLSYKEMSFLFNNKDALVDNFLSFLPQKIKKFSFKDEYIPSQTYIENINILYFNYTGFYDFHFQNWNDKKDKKREVKETDYYRFDFNFHFIKGTKESLLFLKKYRKSTNQKFILSPFRHIINYKWQKIKKFLLLLSIIYWLHLFFFSMYLINQDQIAYFLIDIFFILILLLHEIFSLLFNIQFYFKEKSNYLDISMLILSISGLIITLNNEKINKYFLSYFHLLAVTVIFYRGFLYLEVFDSFRHLINMIIGVTKSIFTSLFVFGYIILAFSVLFIKIERKLFFYPKFEN